MVVVCGQIHIPTNEDHLNNEEIPSGSVWQADGELVARSREDSDLLHDLYILISPNELFTVLETLKDPLVTSGMLCKILRSKNQTVAWLQTSWFKPGHMKRVK